MSDLFGGLTHIEGQGTLTWRSPEAKKLVHGLMYGMGAKPALASLHAYKWKRPRISRGGRKHIRKLKALSRKK